MIKRLFLVIIAFIFAMMGCQLDGSIDERPIVLDRVEFPQGGIDSWITILNNALSSNRTGLQINVDQSPPIFCNSCVVSDKSQRKYLSCDLRRQMITTYTNVVSAKFVSRMGNSFSGTHVMLDDVLNIISHTFKCSFTKDGDLLQGRVFQKQVTIEAYAIPANCEPVLCSTVISFVYMESDPLWDKDACLFICDRNGTIAVINSPENHIKAKNRIEAFFSRVEGKRD